MKITDVTVQNFSHPMPPLHGNRFRGLQEVSLVTVTTDEGVEGHAMARAQGGASGTPIAEHIVRTAKPLVVGENPLDRERIWRKLFALDRGIYAPIFVTSALDVAIWDIAGKIMGQPIHRVLGGYRDRIAGYATSAHRPSERMSDTDRGGCDRPGHLTLIALPRNRVRQCRGAEL